MQTVTGNTDTHSRQFKKRKEREREGRIWCLSASETKRGIGSLSSPDILNFLSAHVMWCHFLHCQPTNSSGDRYIVLQRHDISNFLLSSGGEYEPCLLLMKSRPSREGKQAQEGIKKKKKYSQFSEQNILCGPSLFSSQGQRSITTGDKQITF